MHGSSDAPKTTYAVSRRGAQLLKDAQQAAKEKKGSGYTLENLARRLGTKKATLSMVFNGKQTTLEQLPQLCEILDVPIYSVLQGLDDEDAAILDAFHELKKANLSKAELDSLRLKVAGLKSRSESRTSKVRGD